MELDILLMWAALIKWDPLDFGWNSFSDTIRLTARDVFCWNVQDEMLDFSCSFQKLLSIFMYVFVADVFLRLY